MAERGCLFHFWVRTFEPCFYMYQVHIEFPGRFVAAFFGIGSLVAPPTARVTGGAPRASPLAGNLLVLQARRSISNTKLPTTYSTIMSTI